MRSHSFPARRSSDLVWPADGTSVPLGQALIETYNLSTPSRKLFENLITKGAADLAPLLDKANAEQFKHFVNGWNAAHDVLDLLDAYPACRLTPVELVESLRKGIPRLYSIASSLSAHPGEVHLLVVSVRYPIRGREREGVASTWLADRWPVGPVDQFRDLLWPARNRRLLLRLFDQEA